RALQDGRGNDVLKDLPSSWEVETQQGRYAISSAPLRAALDPSRKDTAGAQFWLDHLAAQLDGFALSAPRGATKASASVDRILARREFAGDAPPDAWDRFIVQVGHWIEKTMRRIFSFAGQHSGTGWLLFWLLMMGGVGLVGFFVVRLWSQESGNFLLPSAVGHRPLRGSEEWIRAARAASDGGDLHPAIQCAYWAGIARLQEIGSLPKDLARTPRECLKLLDKTQVAEPLGGLTLRLERFWYARQPASPEDFSACLAGLEALGCQVD
ncbi:MAG: DUF4129 domain-containing protein, partial [Acidobacteriota bacterium]|nr:DUF4129 domain-containing protein [Acidobacteriota bacterium]